MLMMLGFRFVVARAVDARDGFGGVVGKLDLGVVAQPGEKQRI